MALSCFAIPVSDEAELQLRSTAVRIKTKAATEWGIRICSEWALSRPVATSDGVVTVTTPLLEMPPANLAYWMAKFVLEVRKKNGSEYPPKTLYALVCCFKRYYEQNGVHDVNPLSPIDARFGNFRVTLDAEMKRLHGQGLGCSTKQAEPITPDEEALLWTSGQFGTHCAKVLINTVYFYNCKVFGLRCYDEHHNLRCSQFKKKVGEQGRVYIEYTDFGNKTNRGGLKHMKVENKTVRQYENTDDTVHCVVNIFELYFSFLPTREKHFYFRPLPDNGSGIPRFGNQPIGRNRLAQIIPEMWKAAGIEGHKTGHSGKVTCATVLYQQNFSDQLIKERTGHRSLEALHKYKHTGSEQQHRVSMALLPQLPQLDKENAELESDDDFKPLKKRPKVNPGDIKAVSPVYSNQLYLQHKLYSPTVAQFFLFVCILDLYTHVLLLKT